MRNRRDNDFESTRGSYTTVEGGVASSYFGSAADFSRFLTRNSSYYTFFRNRTTGQGFVLRPLDHQWGLKTPFANTAVLDPWQEAVKHRNLIPLPERFYSGGGNSQSRFRVKSGRAARSLHRFPIGGSAVFLNSVEMRFPNVTLPYLNDQIGFTIFHDMGNVFARPQEMLPSLPRFRQPDQQTLLSADAGPCLLALWLQLRFSCRGRRRALSDTHRPIKLRFRIQFKSAILSQLHERNQ
jgi:outer membrane protein insertion porin family